MTLEEKIALTHGNSKFTVGGIDRLDIPVWSMSDGPHGVREENKLHVWEAAGWTTADIAAALPLDEQRQTQVLLGEVPGHQIEHTLVDSLALELGHGQTQLLRQAANEILLFEEAHLEQGGAQAPSPALLLSQSGAELILVDDSRPNQDFADALPSGHFRLGCRHKLGFPSSDRGRNLNARPGPFAKAHSGRGAANRAMRSPRLSLQTGPVFFEERGDPYYHHLPSIHRREPGTAYGGTEHERTRPGELLIRSGRESNASPESLEPTRGPRRGPHRLVSRRPGARRCEPRGPERRRPGRGWAATHRLREARARQRPDADRARGPQGAHRRGQRLVPRRLEEREARARPASPTCSST